MTNKYPIDIVIPWVDGNDPEWQTSFKKYSINETAKDDNSVIRYRDWDNVQYVFRGIEKFAPWVNKVHFITNGQTPKWLNLDAPKLNFVKHDDFIPKEWLPTFSVRPIELNLHRIESLSERFIYFNDDFFITSPVTEKRFFKRGLPCDIAVLDALMPTVPRRMVLLNDVAAVNRHFDKRRVVRANWSKWYNLKYGSILWRTIALTPWSRFSGFRNTHLPQPYLKSVISEVWEHEENVLVSTCSHRFRDISDLNQSVFRFWQLASGRFYPTNVIKRTNVTSSKSVTDHNIESVADDIIKQKYDLMVLNDSDDIADFEKSKAILNNAFQKILPEKSSFEI